MHAESARARHGKALPFLWGRAGGPTFTRAERARARARARAMPFGEKRMSSSRARIADDAGAPPPAVAVPGGPVTAKEANEKMNEITSDF